MFSLLEFPSIGGSLGCSMWRGSARLLSDVQIPFRCVNVTQAAVFADWGSHISRNVAKQM